MNQKKHIRSLFLLNVEQEAIESSYWKSFQHLKILNINCTDFRPGRLPRSFRLLRGLKQLRICNKIGGVIRLPTRLNTLKKLEILDLSTYAVKFPNVALEMNSLRHIYGRSISGLIIKDSWKNRETLKHIKSVDWIKLVDWMRSSSRMKDVVSHIQELGILITKYQPVIEIDEELIRMRASLEKLENLVKFKLNWRGGDYFPGDGTTYIPRLPNLTKLKLSGWMMKCPSASVLPLHQDPMQEWVRGCKYYMTACSI